MQLPVRQLGQTAQTQGERRRVDEEPCRRRRRLDFDTSAMDFDPSAMVNPVVATTWPRCHTSLKLGTSAGLTLMRCMYAKGSGRPTGGATTPGVQFSPGSSAWHRLSNTRATSRRGATQCQCVRYLSKKALLPQTGPTAPTPALLVASVCVRKCQCVRYLCNKALLPSNLNFLAGVAEPPPSTPRRRRAMSLLHSMFLPAGYPDSVAPGTCATRSGTRCSRSPSTPSSPRRPS